MTYFTRIDVTPWDPFRSALWTTAASSVGRQRSTRTLRWSSTGCVLQPWAEVRGLPYLKLDNAVKALTRADPLCTRLVSIPGVGPVTALTFKSAVDDRARFKASRTVAVHFGLTPKR